MYYKTFEPFLSPGKGFPWGLRSKKGAWYALGERNSEMQENVEATSIYWYYSDVIETKYHVAEKTTGLLCYTKAQINLNAT